MKLTLFERVNLIKNRLDILLPILDRYYFYTGDFTKETCDEIDELWECIKKEATVYDADVKRERLETEARKAKAKAEAEEKANRESNDTHK